MTANGTNVTAGTARIDCLQACCIFHFYLNQCLIKDDALNDFLEMH